MINERQASKTDRRPDTSTLLPYDDYDYIVCSFSGGKDSGALVLALLEDGAPREKIELWHQDVDGREADGMMDWPVTRAYCKAFAKALGLPILFQWKEGGFEGEMLREESRTKGVFYEDLAGEIHYLEPSTRGKLSTRRKFPQVSADLSVRWCSAYLKIDVAARAINSDPRFKGAKVLFVTGERREESPARARYAEIERHRCSNKSRRVDQWRSIIDWTESDVWAIWERWSLEPHPAYRLGWGRLSCQTCIFGDDDQWASVKAIAPERFAKVAGYEAEFGTTIKRNEDVIAQAERGRSFIPAGTEDLQAEAMGETFDREVKVNEWTLPAGAFKRSTGPS